VGAIQRIDRWNTSMPQWALNAFSPVLGSPTVFSKESLQLLVSAVTRKVGQKAILSVNSLKLLYLQGQCGR
jgi:hypothetical protein